MLARSRHPVDRAIASAYLAVIKARSRDPNAAMQYADTAQASGGEHRLVCRLLDAASSHAGDDAAHPFGAQVGTKEAPCALNGYSQAS